MGVAIMDMFPSEYGIHLTDVPYFIPAPGGAPANVAVAAAKLGAECAFIGKVGEDIFGHHLASVYESMGICFGRKPEKYKIRSKGVTDEAWKYL